MKLSHTNYLQNVLLRKEKIQAELNYLKTQVNPHFLFNTLNNLYSLSINKPELTSNAILKVSELLNYMLYETEENEVALSKELEILLSYLELENMKENADAEISFIKQGDFKNIKIAPLLLLPIVENAFKHGLNGKKRDNRLDIVLEVDSSETRFSVENNFIPRNISNNQKTGLGLENIKKRMKLIYDSRAQLETKCRNKVYKTILKIKHA